MPQAYFENRKAPGIVVDSLVIPGALDTDPGKQRYGFEVFPVLVHGLQPRFCRAGEIRFEMRVARLCIILQRCYIIGGFLVDFIFYIPG
jgi:hypothetical protein